MGKKEIGPDRFIEKLQLYENELGRQIEKVDGLADGSGLYEGLSRNLKDVLDGVKKTESHARLVRRFPGEDYPMFDRIVDEARGATDKVAKLAGTESSEKILEKVSKSLKVAGKNVGMAQKYVYSRI